MQSYIKSILGKSYEDIQLSDVESYFQTPQVETSVVEFKSGDVDIVKIFKEIAAFHNTEGGLLIIGAPIEIKEEFGKTKIKRCHGVLTYSNFNNKDWLLQKIGSNIIPYPIGIRIKEFRNEKGAIFLVDIPQSSNPPHQCTSDGCYYIRVDNESKPAPHGFVQAMFNQRRSPKLVPTITIVPRTNFDRDAYLSVSNESAIPADKAFAFIEIYNTNTVKIHDEDLKFEHISPNLKKHYSLIELSPVLPRRFSVENRFFIQTIKQKLLFAIATWSKNCDTTCYYFLYDLSDNKLGAPTVDQGGIYYHDIVDRFLQETEKSGNPNMPLPN